MRLKRPDGMNVVPFIDVMLVLLAIVLTVSTFIAQGKIKIDLPEASSAEPIQQAIDKKLEISVSAGNELYVDDIKSSIDELKIKLAPLNKDFPIVFKSDKDSKFELFIQVLDVLKDKGHENFEIITKQQH